MPDNEFNYVYLGMAYVFTGKNNEAIDAWEKALKIRPDFEGVHMNLGRLYILMNDKESALKQYETLKKLNPSMADKLYLIINKKSSAK